MFSDHQPYFTVIDNAQHCNSSPKYKLINEQDKDSINKFHKETIQSLQNASISDSLTTNPNVNYLCEMCLLINLMNVFPEVFQISSMFVCL